MKVSCASCGRELYDGPSDSAPSEVVDPPSREPCPQCGSIERLFEAVGAASVSGGGSFNVRGFEARGPKTRGGKHPYVRETKQQRRTGRDSRTVDRFMVIDREHDPPYKWHRVIDVDSGEVIKNVIENHATGESHHVSEPDAPVPEWFPRDPRA